MNLRLPLLVHPHLGGQTVGRVRSESPDSLLLLVTLKLKKGKKRKEMRKIDFLETNTDVCPLSPVGSFAHGCSTADGY